MFRRRPQQKPGKAKRSRAIHQKRSMRLERLEQRQLLAADSLGVTPLDTGEFLLGTVAVTPVLFESDGSLDGESQNWTSQEIDQALARVADGVGWWTDTLATLNTVHSLEFVIDDTFAVDPVETPYEPIDRVSSNFELYVGDFITAQGYGDANSIEEGVQRFNHDQRLKLGTDWAFTIFIVDSSDDPDGLFASGGSFAAAFAYAGGLFIVSPSTRPASTISHEMGHIFWARDEYETGGSWTDRRGYYDTQNLNAPDNPSGEQVISIMRGGVPLTAAYEANVSPASTLAMVGWQDSDGDGVFDVADVPLRLDGLGYFDAEASVYHLSADAAAVPLMNRNSSGQQSDITLNQINQLQYQLDGGDWIVAAEPNAQSARFELALPIDTPFASIHWRVIDLTTGMTSPILDGTAALPAISVSSVSGIAFLDQNGDGVLGPGESPLSMTEVVVRHGDGSRLTRGSVDASSYADGAITDDLAGVTIAADGLIHGVEVGSFESDNAGGARVLHAFDQQRNKWIDRWSKKVAFTATFDKPVGVVKIDAIGLDSISFARIEAYDSFGNLLTRTTSGAISNGDQVTVQVADSRGRIASVRVFGHAESSVAISALRFGASDRVITDQSGAWRFTNLPDGDYIVELLPDRVIHRFGDGGALAVEVIAGSSPLIVAAADRVDSPRHNSALAEDVNRDGSVTASDALAVINDLARFEPRILSQSDVGGFDVDVSNDGTVSALDALLVINFLGRETGGVGEFVADGLAGSSGGAESAVFEGPALEPIDLALSQMFDSAGGTTDGESTEDLFADNNHQRPNGQHVSTSKISGFPEQIQPFLANATLSQEPQPRAANDTENSNNSIHSKISEPFDLDAI